MFQVVLSASDMKAGISVLWCVLSWSRWFSQFGLNAPNARASTFNLGQLLYVVFLVGPLV